MSAFKKIAILGVGFMGGSLALALKEAYPGVHIWGYARKKSSYQRLCRLKLLDRVERDIKDVVRDSDIIILSAPVYTIIEYCKVIAPFLKPGAIVIDLGSSKELIEKSARACLPHGTHFVGCHPLCGSDKSGAVYAQKNLYQGSLCLITSSKQALATRKVQLLWQRLGSYVVFIDARTHDKILSSVSHLTHLVAFSLIDFVPKDRLRFIPPSFKEVTRIANSPAAVWADIFLSNRKHVLSDLNRLMGVLRRFEMLIQKQDKRALCAFIEAINKKQKRFLNSKKHLV
ncbi:MAG: prephenate dehydrogenase [Candidatus Omnitrophota bacterium]